MAHGKRPDALQAKDPWTPSLPESEEDDKEGAYHTESRAPTQVLAKACVTRVKRTAFSPKPTATRAECLQKELETDKKEEESDKEAEAEGSETPSEMVRALRGVLKGMHIHTLSSDVKRVHKDLH